jgi:hypothetical protein
MKAREDGAALPMTDSVVRLSEDRVASGAFTGQLPHTDASSTLGTVDGVGGVVLSVLNAEHSSA